jgi:hypothetical protein
MHLLSPQQMTQKIKLALSNLSYLGKLQFCWIHKNYTIGAILKLTHFVYMVLTINEKSTYSSHFHCQ